jgi:alpha-glucosidase
LAASSRTLGPVGAVEATDFGAEMRCAGGALRLDALAVGVIRVRASPDGEWKGLADWDVLSVPSVPWGEAGFVDSDDVIRLSSGGLTAEVAKSSGTVRFLNDGGIELAADDRRAVSWSHDRVSVVKRRHRDERHCGFGERSRLDQTGGTKTFWNVNARLYGPASDEMYCSVPVFLAYRGGLTYGFLLNAPGWSQIRSEAGSLRWTAEVVGRELDYVVAHAADPAGVLERLTALVGRIDLPPRWALGYHQSHWGYDSAQRVLDVAEEFTRRSLPCDVIHLDITYMDEHRVFTWDRRRFPDPAGLVAELSARGLQCVAIVDPGVKIEQGNDVYDDGVRRDAFVRDAEGRHVSGFVWPGECVFPDFLRADVRAWWSGLHVRLLDSGVAGIWNDMNEPAIYAEPVGSAVTATVVEMPGDAVHRPAGHSIPHRDVHNLYGLSMARAAVDAMRRQRPNARPFALTRSGFAGIQRYAAVWTGDNSSTWEHLQLTLPMLCNLGLSGVPFVGADVGGFWGDAEPELYARWIQAAVLYPLMRGHSHLRSAPNEPWGFGPEVEAASRAALRLRYELIPYLYTLFHEAATTGAPVLRPLLWSFGGDPRAAAIDDEVLLGASLLAAPVCQPGRRRRAVYLPAGRWYDWWTGGTHDGPTEVSVDAPLDRLPLFARAGALVPVAVLDDAGRPNPAELTLRVFPGIGTGTLYDDDGESLAYRDGTFALRRYEVRGDGVVSLSAVEGSHRPARRLAFTTPDGRVAIVADTPDAVEVVLE